MVSTIGRYTKKVMKGVENMQKKALVIIDIQNDLTKSQRYY